MKRTWSDYHIFQLYFFYPFNRLEETAWAIGKTTGQVKAKAKFEGLRKEVKHYGHASTSTPAIDKFLNENYLIIPVKTIAHKIKRSHTFVQTRLRQLNLVIPAEIIEQRKKDSRIKPGSTSWNKGKRLIDIMSPEAIKASSFHRFKKGQLPHNTKKVGDVVIQGKGGFNYQYIKLAHKYWRPVHILNWEKINGKVPEGMIVVFKDGNSMNCEPYNLELITKEENMKRNTIHRYPDELKEVIRLQHKIERTIKNKRNEKQTA